MHQDLSFTPSSRENIAPDNRADPIHALIEELNTAGLRYCHWKSNIRLPESLRGEDDLDLLVHREDADAFDVILAQCGFKPAVSRGGLTHPGVFHAYALDASASRLLHVHAYFRVVTGDSLVKCYRLPIERDLLGVGAVSDTVPLPTPEAELALFTLRILLKHLHPVEIWMVRRGYEEVVRELDWLRNRADLQGAAELWRAWMPASEPPALETALAAIAEPRAWLRRVGLGLRLASGLLNRRRIGTIAAEVERLRRVGRMAIGRFRRRRDLVPRTGGLIVSMVGPKAVGKSTLSGELARRLGRELDVRRVHVGKPPPTLLSFAPRLILPLARRLFKGERSGEYQKPERRREGRYSLLYVLRMTLAAYDRRALIRKCWKAAASGTIIVTDRYPSETPGAIDSSCFNDAAIAACDSGLKRWLMRRERALYLGLPRPDLVIRLTASRETAVRRDATRMKEGGPDADAVLRRWRMETSTGFGPVPVITVDTDRTIEESAADVTRAVWRAI
ncbi:AAA family ATPase [Defluviimonas salinarum]|uniref:AAA family ATPase n=1 Tax=Defluviimonas salinarum TaxID=2992147 RepID=A0ABT3IYX9_9RHOB|nr:AAA family ATPase [Defluviimonas salinarum]MCW3780633.1 AAA family ATPase [Defluviimonas salinarum]